MKFLNKIRAILLIAMPAVLFFSFHPVISLGENSYMNFELSLPEIWLVIFFLVNLPQIKNLAKFYGPKKTAIAFILPLYFSISIIWSANHARAILTCGIFWLLVFAALNIIYVLKKQAKLQVLLQKSLLISAAVVSAICLLQCALDLAGLSQQYTLMCNGCTYKMFGFPHPNGFAIEPQFMGNLLLAPALLCLYLLATKKYLIKKPAQLIITILIIVVLFLTLSRGAIYAFLAAAAFQQIYLAVKNKKVQSLLKSAGLVVATFALALFMQGMFATVSKTSDTFYSGVTKSLHQLSLGKIDLRPQASKDISTQPSEPTTEAQEDSKFSGYVAESTDTRVNLNSLAIKTWVSNPQYLTIGTGLGSAGIAMNGYAPSEIGPKEIVQNEYVSLLLETGALGCVIILAIIIYVIKKADHQSAPLLYSILIGFALTLLFFSGLPNALHIYLFPLLFISTAKYHAIVAKKV